jgi:hypothetical protein
MKPLAFALALYAAATATFARGEEPLPDPELADLRGGLMTPMGYEVGFAANVRTVVDGDLALETRLSWADGAPVVARALDARSSIDADGWTVVSGGEGGATRVRHEISLNRIASVVVNTADGRRIAQDTQLTLFIPQLSELQARVAGSRLAAGLQEAINASLVGTLK